MEVVFASVDLVDCTELLLARLCFFLFDLFDDLFLALSEINLLLGSDLEGNFGQIIFIYL